MGFFTNFFNAISNVSQGKGTDFGRNTGAAIQNFAESVRFNEPTRLDRFLAGPGQTIDMSKEGRQARFEANVAANEKAMAAMADMRDPGGERTDPNTGRSVRETRGYEDKSTASLVTGGGGGGSGGSTKTSGTTTELKPPVAPATVADDPASSGELEDEAMKTGKKGRKGTILTSSQGLLSDAPVREKRKLKGLIS
tara:strand:- start:2240 stop:2827 length:588 start_codon:yes stop_codon:yes gene_type:complete